MIGLDTNVLVRYIVRDDKRQTQRATELIESSCTADTPGFVNVMVLCELCWVLGRGYGYDRGEVARVMRALLGAVELTVEHSELVWQAVRAFERGPADLPDYLIGGLNRAHGAESTCTFDRRAARHADFSLVPK